MNQLKYVYNCPFKDSHSHLFPIIASDVMVPEGRFGEAAIFSLT